MSQLKTPAPRLEAKSSSGTKTSSGSSHHPVASKQRPVQLIGFLQAGFQEHELSLHLVGLLLTLTLITGLLGKMTNFISRILGSGERRRSMVSGHNHQQQQQQPTNLNSSGSTLSLARATGSGGPGCQQQRASRRASRSSLHSVSALLLGAFSSSPASNSDTSSNSKQQHNGSSLDQFPPSDSQLNSLKSPAHFRQV